MTHATAQGYVRTPGGFRHKSFVHRLPPNHIVRKGAENAQVFDTNKNASLTMTTPASRQASMAGLGGGWVTWSTWVNTTGSAITRFVTTWTVPPAPGTDSGQLIYLFNALDQAGGEILQPVLQWGSSGAGGGSYWGIANWYVDSNHHAFCTQVVRVQEGTVLTGILELAIQPDASLNYTSSFQGMPGVTLVAQGLSELVPATETLEVYGLTKASDYPNAQSTSMSGIDIQVAGAAAPLQWVPSTMDNPPFGERTVVVNGANPEGQVDLFY